VYHVGLCTDSTLRSVSPIAHSSPQTGSSVPHQLLDSSVVPVLMGLDCYELCWWPPWAGGTLRGSNRGQVV